MKQLDDSNFMLYAASNYDNPQCYDTDEFYDDLKRFKYLKRLLNRYKETGELKYIDFSHANAYDTLVRPFQAVLNSVAAGNEDEDGMMDDFMLGVMEAEMNMGIIKVLRKI